jgi:hypothetical protein
MSRTELEAIIFINALNFKASENILKGFDAYLLAESDGNNSNQSLIFLKYIEWLVYTGRHTGSYPNSNIEKFFKWLDSNNLELVKRH